MPSGTSSCVGIFCCCACYGCVLSERSSEGGTGHVDRARGLLNRTTLCNGRYLAHQASQAVSWACLTLRSCGRCSRSRAVWGATPKRSRFPFVCFRAIGFVDVSPRAHRAGMTSGVNWTCSCDRKTRKCSHVRETRPARTPDSVACFPFFLVARARRSCLVGVAQPDALPIDRA